MLMVGAWLFRRQQIGYHFALNRRDCLGSFTCDAIPDTLSGFEEMSEVIKELWDDDGFGLLVRTRFAESLIKRRKIEWWMCGNSAITKSGYRYFDFHLLQTWSISTSSLCLSHQSSPRSWMIMWAQLPQQAQNGNPYFPVISWGFGSLGNILVAFISLDYGSSRRPDLQLGIGLRGNCLWIFAWRLNNVGLDRFGNRKWLIVYDGLSNQIGKGRMACLVI